MTDRGITERRRNSRSPDSLQPTGRSLSRDAPDNSRFLLWQLEIDGHLHGRLRLGVIVPVQYGFQRCFAELVRPADHTGIGDRPFAVERGFDHHGSLDSLLNRVSRILNRSAM